MKKWLVLICLGLYTLCLALPLHAKISSHLYTSSGIIDAGDDMAIISSVGTVIVRLGSGKIDGHQMYIKRYGRGNVVLQATIDGVLSNNYFNNATIFHLIWLSNMGSWVMLNKN